jgi:nitrogen regulatory protein PII
MKMICAIVRPYRLEEIKAALAEVGIAGMTITSVHGVGRQKGQVERYRSSEYSIDLISKMKIEVGIPDEKYELALKTICETAHTGEIGDGKIFVYDIAAAVRIRTGESGEDAL